MDIPSNNYPSYKLAHLVGIILADLEFCDQTYDGRSVTVREMVKAGNSAAMRKASDIYGEQDRKKFADIFLNAISPTVRSTFNS